MARRKAPPRQHCAGAGTFSPWWLLTMRERRGNLTGGPHALPVCSHAPSLASLGPERGLRRHRVRRGGVDAPDGGHPRTRLHHPFGNGPGGILMWSSGLGPRLLAASLYSVAATGLLAGLPA